MNKCLKMLKRKMEEDVDRENTSRKYFEHNGTMSKWIDRKEKGEGVHINGKVCRIEEITF